MKETRWQRFVNFIEWLPEAPRVLFGVLLGIIVFSLKRREP